MAVVQFSRGRSLIYHSAGVALGVVMLYPVLWMLASSFMTQAEIFGGGLSLIPEQIRWSNFVEGWRGFGRHTFTRFFRNSFVITALSTAGSIASCLFVAYGFARIKFRGRGVMFAMMMATLLLPFEVQMIPRYLVFHRLGWINTYLPIIVPNWLASNAFFVFLFMQFMRSIPIEMDESAYVDGCGRFRILVSIIVPLCKPAIMTVAIFSFYWTWNNFIEPLVYLSRPQLYPVSVALRLFADPAAVTNWGAMFAMATASLIPVVVVFLVLQRYIVEGISTSGLKG